MDTPFSPISEVIDEIQAGRMVVVCDDLDRENEGDLAMAADAVTPEAINFMAQFGRGLICLGLEPAIVDRLHLPMMTPRNRTKRATAFTVSIEARRGITTGISAADRAHTIQTAIRDDSSANDLVSPGHLFPLRAADGGVLVRTGHTEASVDLAHLAGRKAAGVICEILNPDGTMARVPDLVKFCAEHGLKMCSIADLVEFRRRRERLIHKEASVGLPTSHGKFRLLTYSSTIDEQPHLALCKGLDPQTEQFEPDKPVLVRVHSECLTGDVFGSQRCDCGGQLAMALDAIEAEGEGVVLYMRQEGRGIGLVNKMRAYELQDTGLDTVEANEKLGFKADERYYGIGAQILVDLGISKMRLLTNNPKKFNGLQGYGLHIVERVPIQTPSNPSNENYLKTKKIRLGHILDD